MEYPSNSNNKKPAPATEAPKQQPIVTGKVIVRKPPIGKRLKDVFIGGDANSVWSYVALDVIVPAIKDTVVEAISMGIERAVYGDARGGSPSRRARTARGSATGHIDYSGFAKQGDRYQQSGRQLSQSAKATLNFDELILDTRTEADSVIEHLVMLIDQYQVAKVADLYDLCKVTNTDYTTQKWGWYDLRSASVERVSGGGYLLNLPRPEQLRD
jgi:hypothetical protein